MYVVFQRISFFIIFLGNNIILYDLLNLKLVNHYVVCSESSIQN